MRIVVALGGNALLHRGERPDSDVQEHNVAIAVEALAALAEDHELIITHGNGPQVGVLAMESADNRSLSHPYPLDSLGAETQGLIGYWLLQELQNQLPGKQVAAVITQTVVDEFDPAFDTPTKFVGPVYDRVNAERVAIEQGWQIAADGSDWRRVVASPDPVRIVEFPTIRMLVESGAVVVCAGGGGIPVVVDSESKLQGVEAVVDKDLTAALLAEEMDADALLVLTDVAGVYRNFGTPHAELIRSVDVADLRPTGFPNGSMGPKIKAVCRFVERTGGFAAIGNMADASSLITGSAGTTISAGART